MINWVLGKLFIGLEPGGATNRAEYLALNMSWDDIHNGDRVLLPHWNQVVLETYLAGCPQQSGSSDSQVVIDGPN